MNELNRIITGRAKDEDERISKLKDLLLYC